MAKTATRRSRPDGSRGQSLVELALILPVILLIVMFALDFGRAFYSWVTVTNAARVAANYAAANPNKAYPNASYSSLVQAETPDDGICPVLVNTYNPTFIDGPDAGVFDRDMGDSARVSVSCTFRILTPIVGSILTNAITVGSQATFPIRPGVAE
jgi:Flp pilus assembly protein TadG